MDSLVFIYTFFFSRGFFNLTEIRLPHFFKLFILLIINFLKNILEKSFFFRLKQLIFFLFLLKRFTYGLYYRRKNSGTGLWEKEILPVGQPV